MLRFVLVFLISLFSSNLYAAEYVKGNFRLLDVDELSMDYYSIKDNKHPYFDEFQDEWTEGAALNFDLSVLKYFKWKNRVYENSANQQVRQVGWKWDLALDLGKYVNLFYEHHSTHVVDSGRKAHTYPLENYYGVRFYFIRK